MDSWCKTDGLTEGMLNIFSSNCYIGGSDLLWNKGLTRDAAGQLRGDQSPAALHGAGLTASRPREGWELKLERVQRLVWGECFHLFGQLAKTRFLPQKKEHRDKRGLSVVKHVSCQKIHKNLNRDLTLIRAEETKLIKTVLYLTIMPLFEWWSHCMDNQ